MESTKLQEKYMEKTSCDQELFDETEHRLSLSDADYVCDSNAWNYFYRIPRDLKLYIFSFLEPIDLFSTRLVCHQWKILSEDNSLWLPIATHIFFESLEFLQVDNYFRICAECILMEMKTMHLDEDQAHVLRQNRSPNSSQQIPTSPLKKKRSYLKNIRRNISEKLKFGRKLTVQKADLPLPNKFNESSKIILLGAGDVGKSTIFTQLKIIRDNGGFSPEERQGYKYVCYSNCITQMKTLISMSRKLNFQIQRENNEAAERIMSNASWGDCWNATLASDIKNLWQDEAIQQTYQIRDTEYQLNCTCEHFFNSVERINQHDYIPSIEDILKVRVRSTGISSYNFTFKNGTYKMK